MKIDINELIKYYQREEGLSDADIEGIAKEVRENSPINKLKQKTETAHEAYEEAFANSEITLNELKLFKINQLDEACNLAIVNGFTYTLNEVEYLFSSSLSAQANFQGTDTLFKDGLITEAEWTVINVATGKIERVMIDQENFNNIKLLVFQHINNNVSKLRNELQPLVENAQDKDELNAITWE